MPSPNSRVEKLSPKKVIAGKGPQLTATQMIARLKEHGALSEMQRKFAPKGQKDPDYARYLFLEQLVIEACIAAQNYEAASDDENALRRRVDSEFLAGLPKHRRDVRKVANFIRRYAGRLGPALKQMHHVKSVRIMFEQKTSLGAAWRALLSAYEQALEASHLPTKKGPFVHRFQHGPLDFGEPIDQRSGAHIAAAETGLLFQLALYFKRYTWGVPAEALGYLQTGEPMPSDGNPCWPLCGNFLAAVFGDKVPSPDDLRRRLSKLLVRYPNLGFVGWLGAQPTCRN